ncbi:MAG: prolyl-tRNA synthetase associated domain-containing protein [Bacteroidetes bacterium]|nr:prolyl-tRNA synthetase associated domain-containing protein [Bacteroidota bacterium]
METVSAESVRMQKVLRQLEEWGICGILYTHPPLPTVEIALAYWKDIPEATHCKNLFFRNHKGDKHYLVIFECSKQLNIRDLEQRLKQGKLSFASAERMHKYLGVTPGSVSPFGLINDQHHEVSLFIDKQLMSVPSLSFHPNDNTASVVISTADFIRFLAYCGNKYELISFDD